MEPQVWSAASAPEEVLAQSPYLGWRPANTYLAIPDFIQTPAARPTLRGLVGVWDAFRKKWSAACTDPQTEKAHAFGVSRSLLQIEEDYLRGRARATPTARPPSG